ncbi:unnamed protein product [Staurois parvus]|uniref:Uncharacterized protein n=1 Tax=Staurois parvus TaxID=386267 RepID=A0ABN9CYH3_9NEOB|nr:unnamed protein product [Staurois parvus]
MVINISFVSKGGRGLRCELVITMCDKLGRNILCSVFCPSEYLENALHAFFMMKKGSGQHRELEELKKNSNANAYKRDLLHLQAFRV